MEEENSDIPPSRSTEGRVSGSSIDLVDAVGLFKSIVQKQFENFSGQLKSEQEVFSKKLKENDLTKLKSEGNKIKFEFNSQILDGLDKLEARAFEK